MHKLLGARGLARKVVQIYGVVAGLVAMGILADESAGIAVALAAGGGEGEVLIEFLDEVLCTAKEVNHALGVVGHKPHVLPCVSFNEAGLFVTEGVEGLNPFALVVLGAEEARFLMEEVAV